MVPQSASGSTSDMPIALMIYPQITPITPIYLACWTFCLACWTFGDRTD